MEYSKSFFKLYSNCIPIRGITRDAIYDLQRGNIYLIPHELYDVIANKVFRLKKISNLQDLWPLLKYLIDEELFLVSNNRKYFSQFPALDYYWDHPAQITNSILIYSKTINYFKLIGELEKLGCNSILVQFNSYTMDDLNSLMRCFENTSITNIELALTERQYSIVDFKKIISSFARIHKIFIWNDFLERELVYKNVLIKYLKGDLGQHLRNDKVDFKSIISNITLFMEANSYNTYYNRKLIIDDKGNIKRSLKEKEHFGNINTQSLSKVIKQAGFTRYWKVKKDKIKVCMDCEFRYGCVDNRLPKYNRNEKIWELESDCLYNPYTTIWSKEQST